MKAFVHLLRREFWEHRGAFLTLPLGLGAFGIFFAILAYLLARIGIAKIDGDEFVMERAGEAIRSLDPVQLDAAWDSYLIGGTALFNVILVFVIFFYMLGALHDDRKDRSILFWKSLPVSDSATVFSKLVSGGLIGPLCWVAAIAVTQVVFMLLTTLVFWLHDIPVWQYLWSPADPLRVWLLLIGACFVQVLWQFPMWAWLLLASAFTKSGRPFLWAVLPWILVGTMHSWVNLAQTFKPDFSVLIMAVNRLFGGALPTSFQIDDDGVNVGGLDISDRGVDMTQFGWASLAERFADPSLWTGLVFGAVCIAAAIWIRRYRDENV